MMSGHPTIVQSDTEILIRVDQGDFRMAMAQGQES